MKTQTLSELLLRSHTRTDYSTCIRFLKLVFSFLSPLWLGLAIFLFILLFLPKDSFSSEPDLKAETPQTAVRTDCTYAREYVTTLEYLRAHKDLIISEPDARRLALTVSKGCSGSAQRFVKITAVLRHAGLPPKDAIQTGTEFSKRTDAETNAFVSVFLTAFLPDSLDMDVANSFKIARSLSTEVPVILPESQNDFQRLAKFCLDSNELGLPRPTCGVFAARITRKADRFPGGVSKPFIELFHFLTSSNGPHLITGQAMELGEQLLDGGQDSIDNFKIGFKYGISPNGLGIGIQEAIQFAKQMAFPNK